MSYLDPALLTYLATPYTHPSVSVREDRYQYACRVTAKLSTMGYQIFSPIVYFHPLAVHHGLPDESSWYRKQNLTYITVCDVVWFLRSDGWETSVGMKDEVDFCNSIDKKFHVLTPQDIQELITQEKVDG